MNGEAVEHMWTWLGDGSVIESVGDQNSVTPLDTGEALVLAEIHQHPDFDAERDDFSGAFLHLPDIGAAFRTSFRVFGTHMVLVCAPGAPYVVAARFRQKALRELFAQDARPVHQLRRAISRCHSVRSAGVKFVDRLARSRTVREVCGVYGRLLPDLDFAVLQLSEAGALECIV